jgi:fumarate reductase subunit D
MAISSKPIVWGPFAGGGTLTAFVTPALMLLTLLAAFGHAPDLLAYDRMHAFMGHWLVKVAAAGVVFLSLWSAAHRLRITCYDLGVRADIAVATVLYAGAIAATAASVLYLARI